MVLYVKESEIRRARGTKELSDFGGIFAMGGWQWSELLRLSVPYAEAVYRSFKRTSARKSSAQDVAHLLVMVQFCSF